MYDFKNFAQRTAAFLIDFLPIYIFVYLLFTLLFADFGELMLKAQQDKIPPELQQYRVWHGNLSFSIWLAYSVIMDMSRYRGSFGKVALGIATVNQDSQRIGLDQSLIRNLFKLVSIAPFFIGILWILISPKRQAWHDLVANTYVIPRKWLPHEDKGTLH